MGNQDDNIYEIHRYGRMKCSQPSVQSYTPPQLPISKFAIPDAEFLSVADRLELGHYRDSIATNMSQLRQQSVAIDSLKDNLHVLNTLHAKLKAMLVELEALVNL